MFLQKCTYRVVVVLIKPITFLRFSVAVTAVETLRSDDGDGNGNVTKAVGLISKTTILHVHHAFCTFLCRHCTITT